MSDCWQDHSKKVKGMAEGEIGPGSDHAAVFGAGICYEVPLLRMCESFNRVTLVDLDTSVMEYATERLESAELAQKVVLLGGDVSTFIIPLIEQIETVLDNHPKNMPEKAARNLILSLVVNAIQMKCSFIPLELPDKSVDFVFSSDVLPYMLTLPVSWLEVKYEQKFGHPLGLEEMPGISQLLYATIKAHFGEVERVMRNGSKAFVETCIASGPTIEDKVIIAYEDPLSGALLYLGIPLFGYDPTSKRMAQLWDLLANFLPENLLPDHANSKDWTILKGEKQPIPTPEGVTYIQDGNVFQAISLMKKDPKG